MMPEMSTVRCLASPAYSRRSFLARVAVPLVLLACAGSAGAVTREVGPGKTYATIQAAIAAANDGDTVKVFPGTYHERIDFLGKAIIVTSTNPLDPTVVNTTIIDGGKGGSVVTFDHNELNSSQLYGFKITNGKADQGGGIYCKDASPRIARNLITENTADSDGAGVCAVGGAPLFERNSIVRNDAKMHAGGVLLDNGNAVFRNNVIAWNTAAGGGGGLFSMGGKPTLENGTFSDNSAGYVSGGGNIYLNSGSPILRNCLITFARANKGVVSSGATPTVTYCDIFGNTGGDWEGPGDPGTTNGNMKTDPLYANPAAGDYHLKSKFGRWNPALSGWVNDTVNSPCIDRGDPASTYSHEPMPNGGRINIGAYGNTAEASKSPPISLAWAGTTGYTTDGVEPNGGPAGTSFTFKVKYSHFNGTAATYVRLYLFEPGGTAVSGSPFSMTAGGDTWKAGVIFTKAVTLSAHGRFAYYFQASAGGLTTRLPASARKDGPLVNANPVLAWAGTAGFIGDGVNPDTAAAGSQFTFKVKYSDADGDIPAWVKVRVWAPNGTEVAGSPFLMTGPGGTPNWKTGAIFTKAVPFSAVGTYKYRLHANDGFVAVQFPESQKSGPVVTAAGDVPAFAMTAQPAGPGIQVIYTLAGSAEVRAMVLNMAGRLIAEIPAGRQEAGIQTLRWNGRNGTGSLVPAGVYLVRVEARTEEGARSQALVAVQMRR
jgi:hypothetical protein